MVVGVAMDQDDHPATNFAMRNLGWHTKLEIKNVLIAGLEQAIQYLPC